MLGGWLTVGGQLLGACVEGERVVQTEFVCSDERDEVDVLIPPVEIEEVVW